VHRQPTKLSDTQALPTSWLDGSTRELQPGGHVHKEAVHLPVEMEVRTHMITALQVVIKPDYQTVTWADAATVWMLN